MFAFQMVIRAAVVVSAIGYDASAWAAFNDTRGESWRAACIAGQSKYTCCKNSEQACRDDCGALEQCKRDCSSSYSACTRAIRAGSEGVVAPGLTGGGAVLDPGSRGSKSGGKVFQKAPVGGALAPK